MRIDELGKLIRAEANAMFDILLKTKKLPEKSRTLIQDMCADYLTSSFRQRKPAEGEHEYERLISYCMASCERLAWLATSLSSIFSMVAGSLPS